MPRKLKILLAVLGAIVLMILGNMFLRFHLPPVTVKAEPLPGFVIGGVRITNSLVTALLVDIILVVLAILATRRMQLVPSGLQNFMEFIVETLYNLTHSIAGSKWAPRFFAIVATIFFYVLVSNWFGLLPGLAAVGFCESHAEVAVLHQPTIWDRVHERTTARLAAPLPAKEGEKGAHGVHVYWGCQPGEIIVPLFRSPSTDLSSNLALALVSVGMTQVFGVMALGARYFTKFFNISGILRAFKPDASGQRRGCAGMLGTFLFGCIEFFVSILEAVTEVAKLLSFSFRLFGNIFAGEVMLLVLASLMPLVLTLPFIGLEVFVGLIQAFIFYVLTLAFFTIATVTHESQNTHSE
ncbi:MAG: F0F1 ATP synthase subunit A [Anaerolineae bacterium]|nr:F0F1 ATP synthase subunit A [Anaerolineae bacterium]MDW8071240.1 FoF1 ATP synthase subunit a [Anaerolineae bacterium]